MTNGHRVSALSLALLTGALASTAEALPPPPPKCPQGTVLDCSNDLGPGGKIIRSCVCDPGPPPASVAVGLNDNGCLLLTTGAVQCWTGTHAVNGTTIFPTYALTSVALPGTATAVAAGGDANGGFACAILSDQTVWCWGRNDHGELGNGTTTASATPVQVLFQWPQGQGGGIAPLLATQIASHGDFACAMTNGSWVACWGSNQYGQLGNGVTPAGDASDFSPIAQRTAPMEANIHLAVGATHACATDIDAHVQCWGDNTAYQGAGSLGGASTASIVPTPQFVLGLPLAIYPTGVFAGLDESCVQVNTGGGQELLCWGDVGPSFGPHTGFVEAALTSSRSVAMGTYDACRIDGLSSALSCWGENATSGLYPTIATSAAPSQVAMGAASECLLTTDGHVTCAGSWNGAAVTVY